MSAPPAKILIAYTDAGGGHKATALALKAVLDRETGHEVVLINPYQTLIADVDLFARLTPYTDEDVYNRFVLQKGWNNLFCLAYYAATLLNVRLGSRTSSNRFADCWKRAAADLVISVMPMSNQGLYRSVRACHPTGAVPFLVVMTDLQESLKYSWLPMEKDYFVVCGTERAHRQALKKPHPPQRVFRTNGLIVHPDFHDFAPIDVAMERRRMGLDPQRPTGCVMYGGNGSEQMLRIAQAIGRMRRRLQMIFLCGHNHALAAALSRQALPYPHVIRTFTSEVPRYFHVSDVLVGKPGPGSISEALVSGIRPLVDVKEMLPQERYNVQWLNQQRRGAAFRSMAELVRLLGDLPDRAPGVRRPVRRLDRGMGAVFEIPRIVAAVLNASR